VSTEADSIAVTADTGFVQLDVDVAVEAGDWLLEVLEQGKEGQARVIFSKEVEVEAVKPWLFLEADKPGPYLTECKTLMSTTSSCRHMPHF
jgi:hypothetical protein